MMAQVAGSGLMAKTRNSHYVCAGHDPGGVRLKLKCECSHLFLDIRRHKKREVLFTSCVWSRTGVKNFMSWGLSSTPNFSCHLSQVT